MMPKSRHVLSGDIVLDDLNLRRATPHETAAVDPSFTLLFSNFPTQWRKCIRRWHSSAGTTRVYRLKNEINIQGGHDL